jgi:hypothetical protein
MSKKDEVTRKWNNYTMRKMEEISEYNAYNRARTRTQNTCLFVCFLGVTNHCGCIFHSPVASFSLLIFEVIDHTQRRPTVGTTPLDE